MGFLARTEVFNHSSTSVFLMQFCFIVGPQCDLGTRYVFGCFCHIVSQMRLSCRKAALPPGCHLAAWFLVALRFRRVRSYSGSANRAVTSTSESYCSLLQEKGDRSRAGRRGCLAEKCFTLFLCCVCFCQPLRCGLRWVSCAVTMDGRPLRSCCAGAFQKVLLFIKT